MKTHKRLKRELTRAIAAQRDVSRRWGRLSGHIGYDSVRDFVDEQNASVRVKAAADALRAVGISPAVDDGLYLNRFPMWPDFAEKMLAAARARRLPVREAP